LITHLKQNFVLLMWDNKKLLPKTTTSMLKMLFFLLKIYKNRLITGIVFPLLMADALHPLPFNYN